MPIEAVYIFIILLLASPFIAFYGYYLYLKLCRLWNYIKIFWLLKTVLWIKIKVYFRKLFNIKVDNK